MTKPVVSACVFVTDIMDQHENIRFRLIERLVEFGVGGDLVMFPGRCDTGSLSTDKSKHGEDVEQARKKNVVRGKKSQTSHIPSSQRVQISKASYCCGQQTTPRPLPWRTWAGRMGDGGVIDLRVLI